MGIRRTYQWCNVSLKMLWLVNCLNILTCQFYHIFYRLRLFLVFALPVVAYCFNNLAGGWEDFENIFYYFFVVLGIVFLALAENVFSKVKKYSITTLDIFLTLFAFYVTLRTTLENSAFWGNESFLVFFTLYLVFFVYKQFFTVASGLKVFLVSITLLGLFASGQGVVQGLGFVENKSLFFNVTGAFVNPQVYGGYLASLLPFTMALYYLSGKFPSQRFFSYLSLITTLFLLIALVLSQARAAWLASMVSAGFFFQSQYNWLGRIKIILTQPRVFVGLLVTLPILLGLLFFLKLDSATGRLLIWRISLPMVWDNLLLGVGYGQFKIHYLDYQANFFALHEGLVYAEKIAGMTLLCLQ